MNSKLLPSIIVIFLSGYAILTSFVLAKNTAAQNKERNSSSNNNCPAKALNELPEDGMIRYPSMIYLDM